MIYLKRFLYILIMSIFYMLMFFTTFLYLGLTPIGMIISFIVTEDLTGFFIPVTKFGECVTFIEDKLESIFLK